MNKGVFSAPNIVVSYPYTVNSASKVRVSAIAEVCVD